MSWRWCFIVIEWTGTTAAVDGAIIHGVYERARDAQEAFRTLKIHRGHSKEILQRKLL